MKILVGGLVLVLMLLSIHLKAQKPLDQWGKEDILFYFEENAIVFEGCFKNRDDHRDILIGRGMADTEAIHFNFYLKDGLLEQTLITVSHQHAFQFVNHQAELNGFSKRSESRDQLGNLYYRYSNQQVELLVINKTADWPEMYFHP